MADIYRQEHIGEQEHIHILHDWHRKIAPWQAPYTPEQKRTERYMPGTGEPIETDSHAGQSFDSELSQWETDGGK